MGERTRDAAVRVGVDLPKKILQVHVENPAGKVLCSKAIGRDKFLGWCRSNLPAGCVVAMEACGGAHHWARQLRAAGFEPLILAAHLVTPFRRQGKGGKNDANDAAAICEAGLRARVHPVPVKTAQQQGVLVLQRLRE